MKISMAARLGPPLAALLAVCFAASTFASDSVWYDDSIPLGATPAVNGGDVWNWVTSNPTPVSGVKAHQSKIVTGLHEHWFSGASATMTVNTGDTLYTYVYIDPANLPSEIMVAWNNGSWEHRAYWGSNTITYGASGSAGRYYMGVMPTAGQWVRLQIPASAVGLAGTTVTGMSFSHYNGRATWDVSGKFAAASTTTTTTTGTTTSGSTTSGSTGTTGSSGTTSTSTGSTTASTGSTAGSSGTTTSGSTTSGSTGTASGSTASTGSTSSGSTTATTDVVSVVATSPTASLDGTQVGVLTFTRTGSTAADLTVNFNLSGTAAKWTDYYRLPQGDMPTSVVIPAGSTSITLSITGRANSTNANPETAIFTLAAATGYTVGSSASATLTLGAVIPTLSIAATSATASIDGNATGLITFTRTGSTTSAVTVNFNLTGSAAKWTDYYRLPQGDMPSSVTIAAGATTATLPITARANSTGANPSKIPRG